MGGEKTMYFEDKYFCRGSPPRRRGKEGAQLAEKTGIRITPAWAGKSRRCCLPGSPRRDHPRVGGEKVALQAALNGLIGSPPRGRGKVTLTYYYRQLERITPAWAGKSNLLGQSPWKSEDHPRVGGEKSPRRFLSRAAQGSPPRGRGKAGHGVEGGQHLGITPAWAGKSLFPAGNALCPWDHPRVGGEKSLILATRTALMGSPPRGRGKASCFHVLSRSSGITPAWAGKRG